MKCKLKFQDENMPDIHYDAATFSDAGSMITHWVCTLAAIKMMWIYADHTTYVYDGQGKYLMQLERK